MTQPARRSAKATLYCVVGLLLLTALDLWTKDLAVEHLSHERTREVPEACEPDASGHIYMQRMRDEAKVLIDGYLEFRYAENCGAAFGMLNDAPRWIRFGVFMTAAVAAVGVLMWLFVIGNGGPLFAWSVPFVVSGAIGNLVDRARLGYVVDFIRFHVYSSFEWPTFNVADITITIGVGLLLLDGMRKPSPIPASEPKSAA
jgi:signal peptidase II